MSFMARSFGVAAAAVLLAGVADAATITQTVNWSTQPTDLVNAVPSPSTLNYFDTTLGTLDSVTITSTYGFSSTFSVTNTNSTPGSAQATGNVRTESGAQFKTDSSAVNAILNQYVNTAGDVTYDGTTHLNPSAYDILTSKAFYTLDPGQTDSTLAVAGSGSTNSGALTSTAALLAFELAGGGSFAPVISTLSGLILSQSGGNAIASQSTTAQGSLTVIYNYTASAAVPEPASWAMMVGGFGLLGAALRRKRNVAVSFG